jgi:hypothetical protein
MFLAFIAQVLTALIERELRQRVVEKRIDLYWRALKTPTIEQVLRLFGKQNRHFTRVTAWSNILLSP